MSTSVPDNNTVCVKGVPHTLCSKIMCGIKANTRPVHVSTTLDKEDKSNHSLMIFSNYSSGRLALQACNTLKLWVANMWKLKYRSKSPVVTLKSDLLDFEISFSVMIPYVPCGTTIQDLEAVFKECKKMAICSSKKKDVFFINFETYEDADSVLQRDFMFKNKRLHIVPTTNTNFVILLRERVKGERIESFSLTYAYDVANDLTHFQIKTCMIEKILEITTCVFVRNKYTRLFSLTRAAMEKMYENEDSTCATSTKLTILDFCDDQVHETMKLIQAEDDTPSPTLTILDFCEDQVYQTMRNIEAAKAFGVKESGFTMAAKAFGVKESGFTMDDDNLDVCEDDYRDISVLLKEINEIVFSDFYME